VLAAALGHTPGAVATCTTPQVCTVCNEVLAAALGHTPGARVTALEPTCLTEGRWEIKCTVCDALLEFGAISALGHNYGRYMVDPKDDTYQYRVCARCGHVDVIDRLVSEIITGRAAAIKRNGLTTANLHLSANNKATLTLVLPGMERFAPIVLSTNANNRNIEGEIYLGDGYFLQFDIKGNGSNINIFEVIYKG